jgi:hypothetical protein
MIVTAVAACDVVVGADFDDLKPLSGSGGADGVGGLPGSGGVFSSGGEAGAATGGAQPETGGTGGDGLGGMLNTGGTPASGGTGQGGTAGSGGTGGTPDGVVINEVRSSSGDFIELHNTDEQPFNLGGYVVTDGTTEPDLGHSLAFATNTMVPAKGYVLILGNQVATGGPTDMCSGITPPCYHTSWGISSSGENVYLLEPDQSIHDRVTVPADLSGSYARLPDGGNFAVTDTVTPGAANPAE